MKKLLFLALLTLPATACVNPALSSPATVAESTKLDEQGAITVNLAYKMWRIAVETGVTSGQIKGPLAGKLAKLDNLLYGMVQAVDAAYAAGNSTAYLTAIANFNTALRTGYGTLYGGQ
jgi:hypothetical protein